MRRGIKRYPYSMQFNEGLSPMQIREESKRYQQFSKADLCDAFVDYFREFNGEDKNIRHAFDEVFRRVQILKQNGMR